MTLHLHSREITAIIRRYSSAVLLLNPTRTRMPALLCGTHTGASSPYRAHSISSPMCVYQETEMSHLQHIHQGKRTLWDPGTVLVLPCLKWKDLNHSLEVCSSAAIVVWMRVYCIYITASGRASPASIASQGHSMSERNRYLAQKYISRLWTREV